MLAEDQKGQDTKKYLGLLLGAFVGDCLGLPFEMLSSGMKKKIFGDTIEHRFIYIPFEGWSGICSDDTEHAWLTAITLCKTHGLGENSFATELSRVLKLWLLTCPIGIGRATLLSCLKLLLGWSHHKSGVLSAGNGAAIRALVIGAFYADNFESCRDYVKISTLMSHVDERATEGALVIAQAASIAMKHEGQKSSIDIFFKSTLPLIKGEELNNFLRVAENHLSMKSSLDDYLRAIGISKSGVSGYMNHTVPAVIYAWLRYYGDYLNTVNKIIEAGGDTDTTACLAGALAGLTVGEEGIPPKWLEGACGWPLTTKYLRKASEALSQSTAVNVPRPAVVLFLCRNIFTFPIYVFHIVRRIICSIV